MSEYGAIALLTGQMEGLDAGDSILLRFNQPVTQVDIHGKRQVDALLTILPSNWAANYTGVWVDSTSLLITVTQ